MKHLATWKCTQTACCLKPARDRAAIPQGPRNWASFGQKLRVQKKPAQVIMGLRGALNYFRSLQAPCVMKLLIRVSNKGLDKTTNNP